MRAFAQIGVFAFVTVAIAAYGVFMTGRPTGASLFLGVSGGTLVLCLWLLYRAARSLFSEPPATEIAVATGRRRKELEREKTALLKALKELEFDHEMGKISDPDFAEIGGQYRSRAIRVLRQLDDREVDYARLVEEELGRHKRGPRGNRGEVAPTASAAVAAPGTMSAATAERAAAADAVTLGCAGCGTINDPDAVFCKKCARRIAPVAATEEGTA